MLVPGRQLVCLTPTRNESWIIRPFIEAAARWAQKIIVADQLSTDGTREFLERDPRVSLIRNDSPVFDEARRQQLLIDAARKVEGKRILIGLDADEALSANSLESQEWKKIADSAPGTILRFRWINILPEFQRAWSPTQPLACGFVDDGSPHEPRRIHSPRVPRPADSPVLDLQEIVVLHFQYIFWERMHSKQRWYQAWELCQRGVKRPLDILRQYNHMTNGWPADEMVSLQPEWLSGYRRFGIDFQSVQQEPITWWDRDLVSMMIEKGPAYFKRLPIWDVDWNGVARGTGLSGTNLADPRSAVDKAIHRVLLATQHNRERLDVRVLERLLRIAGW